MLNWLLILVPVAIALEYLAPERHLLVFAAAALAIERLRQLTSELHALEVSEEAIVLRLEATAVVVHRRPDVSPVIVLGVVLPEEG